MSDTLLTELIRVQQSNIHGMGLFAAAFIAEGDVIGYVEGEAVHENGPHVLWINGGEEALRVVNDFRFINHHGDPNACYYDDLAVVALRDIAPGEEITHDYGPGWDPEADPV